MIFDPRNQAKIRTLSFIEANEVFLDMSKYSPEDLQFALPICEEMTS
jgi:hypothetical protein